MGKVADAVVVLSSPVVVAPPLCVMLVFPVCEHKDMTTHISILGDVTVHQPDSYLGDCQGVLQVRLLQTA